MPNSCKPLLPQRHSSSYLRRLREPTSEDHKRAFTCRTIGFRILPLCWAQLEEKGEAKHDVMKEGRVRGDATRGQEIAGVYDGGRTRFRSTRFFGKGNSIELEEKGPMPADMCRTLHHGIFSSTIDDILIANDTTGIHPRDDISVGNVTFVQIVFFL